MLEPAEGSEETGQQPLCGCACTPRSPREGSGRRASGRATIDVTLPVPEADARLVRSAIHDLYIEVRAPLGDC